MKKTSFILLLLIFIILSVINGYIFINRNNGFFYTKSLDYRSLYSLKEDLSIRNIEVKNDSAHIIFTQSPEDEEWLIVSENNKYLIKGRFPSVALINGLHKYSLQNLKSGKIIHFTADYSSFLSSDSSQRNLYISQSDFSLKGSAQYNFADWKFKSKFSTNDETEKIKKILSDSVKIDNYHGTLRKIEKISLFLLRNLSEKKGTPDNSMKSLSPYMQYKMAIDGKSKIWCENFSEIYLEFANIAGIPSRYVASNLKIGNTNFGGHVFAESYIKEQKRWAYIDLSSSKVYTFGTDSLVLNSVDIYNHILTGSNSKYISLVFDSGKLIYQPFDSINNTEKYYFNNNSDLIFLFSENDAGTFCSKLTNYFYPKNYYAFYAGTNSQNNIKFYFKQLFLSLYCIVIFSLLITFLVLLRKKTRLSSKK